MPEPLYLANHTLFSQQLGQMRFPTAVISLTQLELLIAVAVAEQSGRVFADLTAGSQYLVANPQDALAAARKRAGVKVPLNELLDDAFKFTQLTAVRDKSG